MAFIKASVTIAYSDELSLWIKVSFIKIKILPSSKKKAKMGGMSAKQAEKIKRKLRAKIEKKRLQDEEKKRQKEEKKKSQEKKDIGEIISNVKMLSSIAVVVIRRFFGHLRIKVARIKIIVATGDAANTAVAYGAITQSLNILLPLLEKVKNFESLDKTDISISSDFTAETPTVDIQLTFSIRVWQLFNIAFAALARFIKHKLAEPQKSTDGHIQSKPPQKEKN